MSEGRLNCQGSKASPAQTHSVRAVDDSLRPRVFLRQTRAVNRRAVFPSTVHRLKARG
jgi:hypothetical protein